MLQKPVSVAGSVCDSVVLPHELSQRVVYVSVGSHAG